MKTIYLLQNNEYNKLDEKATYILDSNIVNLLKDLFYKPQKLNEEERKDLEELLNLLKDQNVIQKIGIAEYAWDFQEYSQDETKAQKINYALDLLLKHDEEHLKRIFGELKETSYSKHKVKSKEKHDDKNLSSNPEVNQEILPTIAVLLKFYGLLGDDIDNIKKGLLPVDKRRNIYKEIIKFVDIEMHIIPEYELWCITEILFNKDKNRDNILELLKLKGKSLTGKKKREKVWNAGWDIFFIKMLNYSASRYMGEEILDNWDIKNPVLITMDKNLYRIGNEMINGGEKKPKHINGKTEEVCGLHFPNISDEDYEFIEDMMWLLHNVNKEERHKFMKKTNLEDHCKEIVKGLDTK